MSLTALDLFRAGFARVADGAGVLLLACLGFQVMFGGSQPFETEALWVGAIGALACWLAPGARRNVPLPLLLYAVVALLSAAVHQWPVITSAPEPDWWALFAPAMHIVVMVVLTYGASHLLRSPRRLSLSAVILTTAVSVLAVQILFDRAGADWVYDRMGSGSLPSVSQWGSLHQTGMVLLVAMPFPLAIALDGASTWRMLSGFMLTGGLLLVGYLNGSRSGVVTMAAVGAALVFASLWKRGAVWPIRRGIMPALILTIAVGLVYSIFWDKSPMPPVRTATSDLGPSFTGGRVPIWTAALMIALDHPWLGVGPGNYSVAMDAGGYALKHLPWFPHNRGGLEQAHNMLLQAGAEIGVPGALALLWLWWWMIRPCWRSRLLQISPVFTLGMLGALSGYFLRSMADSFLDNLVTSDRTRLLVGMLLGAALALSRLPLAAGAKE